jgi:hypothetical protein
MLPAWGESPEKSARLVKAIPMPSPASMAFMLAWT